MRIVALITHNDPGGAQYALMRLQKLLRQYGHSVELVFMRGVAGGLTPDGARILDRGDGNARGGRLAALLRLFRYLRGRQPDAVIAFLPWACTAGLAVAFLAGVKLRIASQRNPGWSYGRTMQTLDLLAGSIGLYSVNIGNSRDALASFDRYPLAYRRRLRLVYNAIEGDFGRKAEDLPGGIALPEGVPLILNVARLASQKNQAALLQALPGIAKAHLVLVGQGDAEKSLKAEAAALGVTGRVHFLGNVPHPHIAALLRRCTVFAQPSLFEGQSNALLEALVSGCAIVCSDIATQAETLTLDDGTLAGIALPASAPGEWAAAINRLIGDENLRRELGMLARKRAEDFSEARMAEGFVAALFGR